MRCVHLSHLTTTSRHGSAPLDVSTAVVGDLPLRGEWRALNTPAERVPSHGTDYFGQRYAYDFVRLDDVGGLYQQGAGVTRHFLATLPASAFRCWDEPIYSAFAGRVVDVGDGWPDRARVNAVWELIRGTLFARPPRGRDYRPLTGNYVIIEGPDGVAMYGHLRCGSIRVAGGQAVDPMTQIGTVGNSGNSSMPHLHFQLMDGADPLAAAGILCAFRGYERFVDGAWVPVERGVPGALERIRSAAPRAPRAPLR